MVLFPGKSTPWAVIGAWVAAWVLTACSANKPQVDASHPNDIYVEDNGDPNTGNARRHPATPDDDLWTIYMAGCTGHLIAPNLMMSANHCQPKVGATYISGYNLSVNNRTSDITVTQVNEADATLDYAIMTIQWSTSDGQKPPGQRFPSLIATKASDVNLGEGPNDGDPVFTVGFPGDKIQTWGVTYAEGDAKATADVRLFFNIGVINGDSGGGVWRKSDHMLVSLTNGGVHELNQPGWNTDSAADISDYNSGPAMWLVYAKSATLQDVFPNGHNRYPGADTGGTGTATGSSTGAGATTTATAAGTITPPATTVTPPTQTTTTDPSTVTPPTSTSTTVTPATDSGTDAGTSSGTGTSPASGSISSNVNILIGEPDPATPNAYTLYIAAPSPSQQLIFCTTATPNDCTPSAQGYTVAAYLYSVGDQAIFQANQTTTLSDGLQISVVAGDASGNPTAAGTLTIEAKGSSTSTTPSP
jgi:hypothetical protein